VILKFIILLWTKIFIKIWKMSLLLYLKISHLFDIVTKEHKVHAAEAQLG